MNSKIILVKGIEIDKEYKNVLNYTENQMLTLCRSQEHLIAEANDYSFLRPTGTIMAGFTYSQCLQANYIAFQNPDYSNKWFFAWIDDVIYKGDKNTELKFTIDAWSTWFDYWTAKTCFVVREHTNDDSYYANTVPEDIAIGDVICEELWEDKAGLTADSGFYVVLATNYIINDNSTGSPLEIDKGRDYSGVTVYGNNIFGNRLLLIKITSDDSYMGYTYLNRLVNRFSKDGKAEAIENMYILPEVAFDTNTLTSHTAYNGETTYPIIFYTADYTANPQTWNTSIPKKKSFSGLTLKNKKCFCYPYNYLFVSNNNGNNNIYKYEDFYDNGDLCVFKNTFTIAIGGSGRTIPLNYKQRKLNNQDTLNIDESLAFGKFPTCAWASDAFTNWLTSESINLFTSAVFGTLGNMSRGKVAKDGTIDIGSNGTALSIAGNIGSMFGKIDTMTMLPNIAGTQPTGDVTWSEKTNFITYKCMRVKDEYIIKIDDFFTRFGYKTNSLKIPNITGRTYWNYIEIGASEEIGYGSVPVKFMEIINNACRKGVTIWHNHANVGNYSLNNTIVS